ncbi:hypothetical protein [Ahrensia kielensis]|uniref:Uncharacterized protein n=1 Tax=Ahrensia kielensis TaxID=76980 RepID=A0ABU9T3G7_9HYPH|nr:hypothetical protein [Ahrensia kielensis]
MEDHVEKPCWNITAWALGIFVVLVCIIAMLSGSGQELASNAVQPVS